MKVIDPPSWGVAASTIKRPRRPDCGRNGAATEYCLWVVRYDGSSSTLYGVTTLTSARAPRHDQFHGSPPGTANLGARPQGVTLGARARRACPMRSRSGRQAASPSL